nr:D-glucuronyl C5-epimerase-like [Lytechinus pictus]
MRLMSRRSCFRTLLFLLATSSFITFTFLLRCHGGSRPEDEANADLLIAARGNIGEVGNTIIDINSIDSRPEDIPSRRHIAEHRQDVQLQQQTQPKQQQTQSQQKQLASQSLQKQQQTHSQQKQQISQSLQQQHQEMQPQEQRRQETYIKYQEPQLPLHQYKEIDCVVNSDYTVQGRLENGEVYLPFSFIHKYFEIQGQVVQYNGIERFEWQHSNAKIYVQDPYRVDGVFMSFHHYHVESRDRVKYFSGVEGKCHCIN